MSEPKLISPLLDGFVMGDPISDHHGVRCCPAMQMDSDSKHIVKVISVPASQVKLDALLLAGAFRNAQEAKGYFKDLAEGVVEEAVVLQRLSRLEGFLPYDNWQVVPMDEGETGYDVYLTSPYRPTLERQLRKGPMTHLAAVNLGLDMCAALTVCRRAGYLYVDLKPGNIFVCDDKEYRIGDLGFIRADSLAYASLPEKYLSEYTAPEITDAYSALNATMDVYAAGLILYQVYNGGTLPFEGRAPAYELPAPAYADGEMAQIILKAVALEPEARWKDPLQMGQALVTYLQSSSVNDIPIVPAEPETPDYMAGEPVEETITEEPSTEDIIAEVDEALDAVGGVTEDELPAGEASGEPSEESDAEEPAEETAEDAAAAAEETSEEETEAVSEDEPSEEAAEAEASEDVPAEETEEPAAEVLPEEETADVAPAQEEEHSLAAEAAALAEELGVSDEVSQILAQADDLIAHETPEGVVAPEPVEIVIPVPEEPQPEQTGEEPEVIEEAPDEDILPDEEPEAMYGDAEEDEEAPQPRKKRRGWLVAIICLVLLADLCIGGYLFYEHYYIQTINGMTLKGSEDRLTVSLDTQVDNELLTVVCTDTYGNTLREKVSGGKASFDDLKPGTTYKVTVEISGLHKLEGLTTGTHITAEQTSIEGFTAVTGSEDGSVILNFTVQGPESSEWIITYSADGEEEKSVTFSGHMVTVSGLTIGSKYTFRLESAADLYLVGTDTVEYTATSIVYAEDLTINGIIGGKLTATWAAPEGANVEGWTVRCYNDQGYDKTITVTGTEAAFEDIDPASAYTVEVNASGMTLGVRAYVSANSVTVQDIQLDDSNRNQLTVSWTFEGTAPAGWLLMYSVDGSEEQQVVQCTDTAGVIAPIVPGSFYSISIQPAGGTTVFGGTAEYTSPAAVAFSGYLLTADNLSFQMCKTPANPEWGRWDVPAADFKTTFAPGENASFAVSINHEYNTSPDEIVTLFVIRDASGKIVSTATQSRSWTSMWYRGFGRFNVPDLPDAAGEYTMEVYFNGTIVHTQAFTISA